MPNGSGRGLTAVLTAVAVIGLIAFVAIAIDSYDTSEDVQVVGAAASDAVIESETSSQAAPPAAPVGGVATGGGGTAGASGRFALSVVGGVAALALLIAARLVGRPREA